MPVGHSDHSSRKFYSISKDGKIRHKNRATGQDEYYDHIEGILTKIDLVEDEYEGEISHKYHFYLEDEQHTQTDVLQVGEPSSAARGIIMSLFSIQGPIGWIRIAPYQKDAPDGKKYTNVWFEHNGQTVDWNQNALDRVPEVKEVIHNGKHFGFDDSERRQFYRQLAAVVRNQKINIGQDTYQKQQEGLARNQANPQGQPAPESNRSENPNSSARASNAPTDQPPHPAQQQRQSGPGNRDMQAAYGDPLEKQKNVTDQELSTADWADTQDDLPF